MASAGPIGAPHSASPRSCGRRPTSVVSYPRANAPCRVERMQASVCAPVTTSGPRRARRAWTRGRCPRTSRRSACGPAARRRRAEFGDVLPRLGALGQFVVGVLHPDHRYVRGAGSVDEGVDVGDHALDLECLAHHAALHVDHHQRGVRPILERRHGRNVPCARRCDERSARIRSFRSSQGGRRCPTNGCSLVWVYAFGARRSDRGV